MSLVSGVISCFLILLSAIFVLAALCIPIFYFQGPDLKSFSETTGLAVLFSGTRTLARRFFLPAGMDVEPGERGEPGLMVLMPFVLWILLLLAHVAIPRGEDDTGPPQGVSGRPGGPRAR
jgi:hypothetical protein